MDFRMEKYSYALVALIFFTMGFFIVSGAGSSLTGKGYAIVGLYALVVTLALIALSCIPVIIYCYIVKKIPDIDYSIALASGVTLVGVLSELF